MNRHEYHKAVRIEENDLLTTKSEIGTGEQSISSEREFYSKIKWTENGELIIVEK